MFALSAVSAWTVEAQTTTEAAARQHFRLGQAHYENGQFESAAREFEQAYRLSPVPRLLYNAYLAYRDMQDLPNAARTLRGFLRDSTDLDSAERDQLAARLQAIETALERSSTSTTTSTSTSTTGAGSSTTDSGSTSSTSGSEPASSGHGSTSPSGQDGSGGGGFSPSPVGFVVGGLGVALGVGAIVTGVLSSSDLSALADACQDGVCPDRPDLRDAQSRGQMLATVTDVLWVSGVVALGVGVALIFALQDGESNTTAAASCTPEGCYGAVSTRF